jgi:hypothetical protein
MFNEPFINILIGKHFLTYFQFIIPIASEYDIRKVEKNREVLTLNSAHEILVSADEINSLA